jgi:ADP-ribose pyrophosphatase YjhB (NUDIX family)
VTRIDYYHDPNAPKANSLVPSVTAIVTDPSDAILLVHKTDNDLWALPGGGMDLGESIAETVTREVKEETGVDVEVTGIVGIYTDPGHVMAYDDGEVRQQCSLCFTTRLLGGMVTTSNETSEVRSCHPKASTRSTFIPRCASESGTTWKAAQSLDSLGVTYLPR